MLRLLQHAFPDIRMNLTLESNAGAHALLSSAMSGTHTGELNLTPFGGGLIPPTGKPFRLPAGLFDYALADGEIVEIRARPNPGGGFEGILAQLGVA